MDDNEKHKELNPKMFSEKHLFELPGEFKVYLTAHEYNWWLGYRHNNSQFKRLKEINCRLDTLKLMPELGENDVREFQTLRNEQDTLIEQLYFQSRKWYRKYISKEWVEGRDDH